jgi:group I intron endonuclease
MSAKPYGVVYKITNTENGKVYIGQTRHKLNDRWCQHQHPMSNCRKLNRAIRKHGAAAFRIEQIAVAHNQEELNRLEVEWILSLKSHLPLFGYNMDLGGSHFSEETRKLIAAARKRYFENPEARANASAKATRHWANPEARAVVSAKGKLRFEDPEFRAKSSLAQKVSRGKPEARAKQSVLTKSRYQDPDYRAKLLALNKATHNTLEYRAELSARRKQYFAEHPEAKQQLLEAFRRHTADPEARAKHNAALKEAWAKRKARG